MIGNLILNKRMKNCIKEGWMVFCEEKNKVGADLCCPAASHDTVQYGVHT